MYKVKIIKDSILENLEKKINNIIEKEGEFADFKVSISILNIENSAHEYIATLVYDTYDISL